MSALGKLKKSYESAAVVALNTVCLILILNLLLGAAYWLKDTVSADTRRPAAGRLFRDDGAPVKMAKRTERQMEWFDFNAYGNSDPEYVADVLDDFFGLTREGFVYQPWVQFSEAPFNGKRVHIDIDERGFPLRRTIAGQGHVAGPTVRIFVLGGSTTFGDLVSDEHTWPSALAAILSERAEREGLPYRIEVLNYGRGWYFPTQEAALLADLLRSGHRPSLVIFMDGVNWGGERDVPQLSPQVADEFIARQHGKEITKADLFLALRWIPMVRLAGSLNRWLAGGDASEGDGKGESRVTLPEWYERAEMAVLRFRQGRELAAAICELYGCEILFFLQPSVLYAYDLDLYRRELPGAFRLRLQPTAAFYERMRQDSGYIDLSQLFRDWGAHRKAVVDDVHYSPEFGRYLAERVAQLVDLDELPVFPDVIDESAATGAVRSVFTRAGRLSPEVAGE